MFDRAEQWGNHARVVGRGREREAILAGCALLAAVPGAAATVAALGDHWFPVGDRAVVAVRAFDVLSGHPPLVGQYSLASKLVHAPTYSPGPMLFWLLAVPAHIGPRALMLTMAILNVLCLAGCVVLARRRGGLTFAVVTAVALAALWRSLPPEAPYDVLNPYAALLPMALLFFCAWSVGSGDAPVLPLLAVVASFVAQCHLAYLGVAIGTAALAVAALARAPPAGIKGTAIAALVVFVVCWAAPIAEQVSHRPGNLVLIARAVRTKHETEGLTRGWNALVRMVGLPPWWLRERRSTFGRVGDIASSPGRLAGASAIAMLATLILALVAGLRRRRRDVAVAAAISLWLCIAVVTLVARTPVGRLGLTLDVYGLAWASVAGMFIWLVLGWALWTLFAPRNLTAPVPALAGLGAATLGLAAAWSLSDRVPELARVRFGEMATTAARVTDAAPRSGVLRLDLNGTLVTNDFHPVITYALRSHGNEVEAPHPYAVLFGGHYELSDRAYRMVISVLEGAPPTPEGQRELARFPGRATIAARPGP